MKSTFRIAIADVRDGLRLHEVWRTLASEDIGDQHKRSTLGPLWLVINYCVFISIFLFLFQRGAGIPHFATYMALGLWVWFAVSEAVSYGVSLFVREESFIKGTRLPLTVYVLRMVMQIGLRMCYTFFAAAIIVLWSGPALTTTALASVVGLALIFAVMPAAAIIFGFLGAYFPDSQYIVGNLMRIGMFVTPVFWFPEMRGGIRHAVYKYNPFTYFLEIVRMPIFDGVVPFGALGLCAVIGVVLWVLALFLLGRLKRNLVFVL